MRIQVEFPQSKVADLNWLKEKGGVKTYYNLFNHALSILKWATQEVIGGNAIASVHEASGKTRFLVTPFLQEAAKYHIPENKAETRDDSGTPPAQQAPSQPKAATTYGGATG